MKESISLISVDGLYFRHHALAWSWSVFKNCMRGHINVINPSKKDIYNLEAIRENTEKRISFSLEKNNLKGQEARVYYACSRFFYAKELLENHKKVLITDADSFFLKKFNLPEQDIGLFLREPLENSNKWTQEGTRVAAGLVSLSGKKGKQFILDVVKDIEYEVNRTGWRWFLDQFALWNVYSKHIDNGYSFHSFTPKDLDWEFKEDSFMWTGKGKRKKKNKRYIGKKNEIEGDYLINRKVNHKKYLFRSLGL